MIRLLTVAAAVVALSLPALAPAAADPVPALGEPAACTPAPNHPYPVVLLHGTMDDASAWNALAPRLTAAGYCVFAPSYGAYPSVIPVGGGVAPIEQSAATIADYVDRVLAVTGAARVDIVGHSQGGTIAEYYAKNLGGASKVRSAILLAVATHGTDLLGTVELANQVPALGGLVNSTMLPSFCPACVDLQRGSAFMRTLGAGPIAQPGVRYSVLATYDDSVVTPAGAASFIDEPGVTNLFVQDLRPGVVAHKDMPSNQAVMDWVTMRLNTDIAD
ncbi:alpha/beta fold hydrolase [Nocardia huaxiensis]|uniref:Alpha/beta fold hydrolase n=1 Tax=Nocardia huaxiensis TaxID=2755382 RepID=A0A7D6ZRP2_9NOCA|nr:alpha/beta fold hydrolase [Nocardia huaxiensis]QLY32185.1 alpha/beta fold hydrolase [Nocardia huaxiensis]